MNTDVLVRVVEARTKFGSREQAKLDQLANSMFVMYTQNGFPPDMFLDKLSKLIPLNEDQKLFIISKYQDKLIEHKRLSGIEEKNLDKVRKGNIRILESFLKTGESGIY